MSHDALEPSLAARIRSLGLAPDLSDVLAELAERTEPAPPGPHESEYEQLLDQAHRGGAARPAHHARPRPPYLRVITGGLAAIWAAAAIARRWVCRSAAHQIAGALVAGTALTAAVVPVARALAPHPPPAPPPGISRQVSGHHWPAASVPAILACPPRRRRIDDDDDDAVRHHHATLAVPASSPSPVSSPTSPAPTPAVSPSPTASPAPTDSPSPEGDGAPRQAVGGYGWSLRARPPV